MQCELLAATVSMNSHESSIPPCRNAAGILIVYDMTDRASFERALRWLNELPNTMPSDAVLLLVGVILASLLACSLGAVESVGRAPRSSRG
jgi:hypothetical protein